MPKLFLVITTLLLTVITTAEAFQFTNFFNSPKRLPETNKMSTEQTFIAIKPDGVMRGLVGEIIGRFEKRGYVPSFFYG
jgi:nucleoside-diphosphate kinase